MKNAIVFATALAVTLIVSLQQPARAHDRTVHDVPATVQVLEGNKVFLEGHAFGTQNYICPPRGSTLETRAACGRRPSPPPPTRLSSRPVRFPGSCFTSSERRKDQPAAKR